MIGSGQSFNYKEKDNDDQADMKNIICNCQILGSQNGLSNTQIYNDFCDNRIYYEIKIGSKHSDEPGIFRLLIRDITEIILRQQQASDKLYRDSVHANYSHEQLTPLNNFLNNSTTLHSNLNQIKDEINKKFNKYFVKLNESSIGSSTKHDVIKPRNQLN